MGQEKMKIRISILQLCVFACVNIHAKSETKIVGPSFDPSGPKVVGTIIVTLSCTPPTAEIFYSIDGSLPDSNGLRYTEPIYFTRNAGDSLKIRAIAFQEGLETSDVTTVTYLWIRPPQLPSPVALPSSQIFEDSVYVYLAIPVYTYASIYYTTDGTAPTMEAGKLYSGKLLIKETTLLKAKAFQDGYAPSDVISETYTKHSSGVNQAPKLNVRRMGRLYDVSGRRMLGVPQAYRCLTFWEYPGR